MAADVRADTPMFQSNGSGQTSGSVGVPSGTTDGDVLVTIFSHRSGSSAGISTTAGWTAHPDGPWDRSTTLEVAVFYRVASSEPASYTWSWSGTGNCVIACLCLTGVDTTTLDTAVGTNAANTMTHTTPTTTTTAANELLLHLYGLTGLPGVPSSDAALTERFDAGDVAATTRTKLWVGSEIQASAGATTARSITTGVNAQDVTVILPFMEATGGSSQTINPALLVNTPTLYTPALHQRISPSVVTNTPTLYAPTLNQRISPTLLTNTPTLYAPTLRYPQTISPALLVNTPTLYAPTLTVAGSEQPRAVGRVIGRGRNIGVRGRATTRSVRGSSASTSIVTEG